MNYVCVGADKLLSQPIKQNSKKLLRLLTERQLLVTENVLAVLNLNQMLALGYSMFSLFFGVAPGRKVRKLK